MTRIAGVSVDVDNLPSKEVLISLAKKTREFRDNPLADKEINEAIKRSGLYKEAKHVDHGLHRTSTATVKPTKRKKQPPKSN